MVALFLLVAINLTLLNLGITIHKRHRQDDE